MVVGPFGIEMFVSCFTPFVNRRYPELIVVEIASTHSVSSPYRLVNEYYEASFFACTASPQVEFYVHFQLELSSNCSKWMYRAR
jgi:hypothetical protein